MTDSIDVTPDEAFTVLTQAISAPFVANTLKPVTTTADFKSTNVSFLSMAQRLSTGAHAKIDNKLIGASWKMQRVASPGMVTVYFDPLQFV